MHTKRSVDAQPGRVFKLGKGKIPAILKLIGGHSDTARAFFLSKQIEYSVRVQFRRGIGEIVDNVPIAYVTEIVFVTVKHFHSRSDNSNEIKLDRTLTKSHKSCEYSKKRQ